MVLPVVVFLYPMEEYKLKQKKMDHMQHHELAEVANEMAHMATYFAQARAGCYTQIDLLKAALVCTELATIARDRSVRDLCKQLVYLPMDAINAALVFTGMLQAERLERGKKAFRQCAASLDKGHHGAAVLHAKRGEALGLKGSMVYCQGYLASAALFH